jgi:membrane protease YdiL (CAAX protease family)
MNALKRPKIPMRGALAGGLAAALVLAPANPGALAQVLARPAALPGAPFAGIAAVPASFPELLHGPARPLARLNGPILPSPKISARAGAIARAASRRSTALKELGSAAMSVQAALKGSSCERSASGASRAFDGFRVSGEEAAPPPAGPGTTLCALRPATRPLDLHSPAPASPRASLGRALRYGVLMGVLCLALKSAGIFGASALGYLAHPGYSQGAMSIASAAGLGPAALFFGRAIWSPIFEELAFRAVLMRGMQFAGERLRLRNPAVWAGALSSLVFVLLHERADPLMIALRLAESFLLSWTYHREGYAASVAQHATINGFLTAAALAGNALSPEASSAALIAIAAAALAAAGALAPSIWRERIDRREGRIGRYRLSKAAACALAALLIAGTLLLIPNALPQSLLYAGAIVHSAWNKGPLDV